MRIDIIVSVLLIAIILYFYWKKEKEKINRYLGKESSLNKAERKKLDYYKKLYKPIPADKRLPTLNRDGFRLDDVAWSATQIIFDSPIPDKKEINNLRQGDLVKLKFVDKDGEVERMWVEYRDREGEFLQGELRNDAYGNAELAHGKTVYFHANHVFQIQKIK
jgi:hypothetical protein